MADIHESIKSIDIDANQEKSAVVDAIEQFAVERGYEIVERNDQKPWGAYLRIDGSQADAFVKEFFPGLTPEDARLGIEDAELSPKFLIVESGQRLSWQLHHRRAERWTFLTRGAYHKSETDEQGQLIIAEPGDVVQFAQRERHRLVGVEDGYTVVAEIWQHIDKTAPSDEDDIIRLEDDYQR